MITQDLLRRIQKKHPNRSLKEIEIVITQHLNVLNLKLSRTQVANYTIPKLGRIHTHGNVKNKSAKKVQKYSNKYLRERVKYNDTQLLF